MDRQSLIDFEKEVARRYEAGEIHAPIHLSGGNEERLLDIFGDIKPTDCVLSTWRSHYHALLHGIEPDEVMRQILAGKSMSINSLDPWFYSSSIVGGILPIAVGLGMALKRKREMRHVFCFVGDTTSLTGIFNECMRYAWNFELPVKFVVEDNGLSVITPTREVWNVTSSTDHTLTYYLPNVLYYQYKLTQKHHGINQWVAF